MAEDNFSTLVTAMGLLNEWEAKRDKSTPSREFC